MDHQCVGNPCDVATGDKAQRETDYASSALSFERTYHSQTLEAHHRLGAGWTHNFDRVIKVSGSSMSGLVRGDGYHEPVRSVATGHYLSETGSGIQVKKLGSEWTAYLTDGTREIYDTSGRLLRIVAPSGQATTLSYSGGVLSQVAGPFGHTLQFVYEAGRIKEVLDPASQAIRFSYDVAGNLSRVEYPDGRFRLYHYEDPAFPNALTGVTDEAGGRYSTFTYDTSGRAISTEHAGGVNRYALSYLANSTTVQDPSGASTAYSFTTDNLSRRVTGKSVAGLSESFVVPTFTADMQRRVTQSTDRRGIVTKFTYDRDHLTSKTEAFGTPLARTTSYLYNSPTDDLPTQITEPNRLTTFTYDANGGMLTRTITETATGASRTWTWTRDGYGRVLTEDGPRTDVSDVTTYTYYTCTTGIECGQPASVTNALSQTTTYNTYNAHGQVTQMTDPNGVVATLAYDARQRLTSRTTAAETTSFEYWPTGLLKKVILADSSFTLYTYDVAQRLVKIEDGEGNRIEYTLDNAGNRTAENTYDPSSALTRTRARVFNSLSQLWKDVAAAGTAAVTTTYGYDANGNQTSIAAPLARNTSQVFDELNRLKQITDPASGITQFAYDANDNLTSITDPRSLVTSYAYNGFGDVTQLTSPDTGVTTSTYDSGGNLATRTDARSKTGTYGYDALNRVTSIAYPDQTLAFTYDAGTNGKGRLTGASDANHSLAFTYDAQGRVIGKDQTVGAITKSVGYGYTAGNLTSLVTPSGQTITYGYSQGRIVSITLNGATTILNQVLYEPLGPVAGWTWGNATIAARIYDQDGKPTDIDSGGTSSYTYDDAFRITGITDLTDSSRSWTHGYDALDRLTSATKSGQTIGYSYDANGNRLTQSGTESATYTVSATSNRLSSITGAPARTYTYDAAGNATGYAGLTFTYSDAGRMSSVTSGSGTTSHVVNALGQRVKKAGPAGTMLFVYDETGHLLGEYDAVGALVRETVWLGDTPVATLRPNVAGGVLLYYVHTDHLNTPRRISRPSDNVIVWRWDSEPFGATAANEDPDGDTQDFAFNLRFPGQYTDSEIGLSYNYMRDFDPSTGRYVESDPIGLKGGTNTYSYAFSSPVMYIDPEGLQVAGCGGQLGRVVCDGKGGFEIRNCDRSCTRPCTQRHEETHVAEYLAHHPDRCRNRAKGESPSAREDMTGDLFYYRSECKAYAAGKACAEQVRAEGCCKPEIVDGYIATANYWMRYFKCDAISR